MVIFHSYVSLPEGRLCLFFFIFSGRIHTLPLEIKPTQQGTWETISIYLTWTTLAVMNQLWQWKILENPFVYSRSLIFFHWNFHGKWNSTCHVWIPEGKTDPTKSSSTAARFRQRPPGWNVVVTTYRSRVTWARWFRCFSCTLCSSVGRILPQ